MLNWQDKTTYSQNTKIKIPNTFKVEIKGVDIIVHRHRFYDGWVLSSRGLDIENLDLECKDLEESKTKAVRIVLSRIMDQVNNLNTVIQELENNLAS